MIFLYNLGISFYSFLAQIIGFFNQKAKLWSEGRKNIFQKIEKDLAGNNSKKIWIHTASVGEFEQAKPIIEQIKNKYVNVKIVLTFFSPSGYELRKNNSLADFIYYLPVDTSKNAKRFFDLIQPDFILFVKYEFWFHYFKEAQKRKIPLWMVSVIFRENQVFFKPILGGFFRKILNCVSHFFVQDKNSATLLESIGFNNFTINSDTRFDRVQSIPKESFENEKISKFAHNRTILIAGSTWQQDEKLLFALMKNLPNNFALLLVPHEINAKHLDFIQQKAGVKNIRYSEIKNQNLSEYKILVLDKMGWLSKVYRYGKYAYVGGAFGKGLHNTLEPAVYGLPIFFGRKYQKFKEAKDLINHGGAFSILNVNEMKEIILNLEENQNKYRLLIEKNKKYIKKNTGATNRIVDAIEL